jgi:hypothetical protein
MPLKVRIQQVTVSQAINDIEQRLNMLLGIPKEERSEYVHGSIDQLNWCRDHVMQSVTNTLPSVDNTTSDDDELDEPAPTFRPQPLSVVRPSQFSSAPCKPHRTHAYIPKQPHADYKQCKWCGDIRPMSHGDKIAYGHKARTKS